MPLTKDEFYSLCAFKPEEEESICAIPEVWEYIQEEAEENGVAAAIYNSLSIEREDGKLVIHNIDGRYLGTVDA